MGKKKATQMQYEDGFVPPDHDPRWGELVTYEWYLMWSDADWRQYIRAELHVPALRRLFSYKESWHTLNDQLEDVELMTIGSADQPVINPIFNAMAKVEATIMKLEKEFGLTLRSAALINMELGEAELNWVQIRNEQRKALKAQGVNPDAIETTAKKSLPVAT